MLKVLALVSTAAVALAVVPGIAAAQDSMGRSMSSGSMSGMKSKSMMMKKHKMMHHHSMHHGMMKKPMSSGGM